MDEFKLLLELNRLHRNDITEKVINELITLDDKDMLMSGEDSGLKNVWEEICAQVQGEKSFYWDMYIHTIEECICSELKLQPKAVRDVLIFIANLEEEEDNMSDDCAVKELVGAILEKADLYTNKNIEKYLEIGSDSLEDENNEDEKIEM